MHKNYRTTSLLLIALIFALPNFSFAGNNVALLVGVNNYLKRGLADQPLQYAERDVEQLSIELKKQGFDVVVLKGRAATKKNFEKSFNDLLQKRKSSDVFLLGFAGHGQQLPLLDKNGKVRTSRDGRALEDAYYCPADARKDDASTLISLTSLVEQMDRQKGVNLVLVDACRDNPDPGRSTRSISGNELNGRMPQNTAIIFSCSSGQQAFETIDAGGGHGVFFYHVLKGLRGDATNRKGIVTWNSLSSYVLENVNEQTKKWFPKRALIASRGMLQTPHELRNLNRVPILADRFIDPDYELGLKLYAGMNTEHNYSQSFIHFSKAAQNNHPIAMSFLAIQYLKGIGVLKDKAMAKAWANRSFQELFELASTKNDSDAQCNLAWHYANGMGVSKNVDEALSWVQKCASSNNPRGQCDLGLYFRDGFVVPQNHVTAYKWFLKAAEQGCSTSQYQLGLLHKHGRGCEKSYEDAIQWFRKSAAQGNSFAETEIGYFYQTGKGVEQDYSIALEWYRNALRHDNYLAQYQLALMYEAGNGTTKDQDQAFKYYKKSAEKGYYNAQFKVGYCYRKGSGVSKDYVESVKWYRRAAAKNHSMAQNNLGFMYEMGYGVDKSYDQAIAWYEKSSKLNNSWALVNLGKIYHHGREGVKINIAKAVKLYQRAAKSSDEGQAKKAKKALSELGYSS